MDYVSVPFAITPIHGYNHHMGIYVNPGNERFSEAVNSRIYVDKTMLLSELNGRMRTEDKFLCVSRPRRFGKTMAESMMAAYYSRGCDSRELFKGLGISGDPGFDRHLNRYNVLHLDVNAFWSQYGNDAVKMMHCLVRQDFSEEFPDLSFPDSYEISNCIMEVYKRTKIPFVVIFDEYDVFFRDENVPKASVDGYLRFLNVIFKNDAISPCIGLAYMTGIFPIIREKAQSKLNNFEEITFLRPGRFAEFTGFTESEVRTLCERFEMDFEECRSWYDGYRIGGFEVYAPRSVVMAMRDGAYMPYWNQTSSFRVIRDVIASDPDGLKADVERMVSGGCVPLNVTMT